MMRTFEIIPGQPGIKCLTCGMVSYNTNDIKYRYCGNCQRFHTLPHKKGFGIYHWDTFDNHTFLRHETDTLQEAKDWIGEHYKGRLRDNGADQVDIVNSDGEIVEKYSVG